VFDLSPARTQTSARIARLRQQRQNDALLQSGKSSFGLKSLLRAATTRKHANGNVSVLLLACPYTTPLPNLRCGLHAYFFQVFLLLVTEMFIFLALIVPLPFTWRRKLFTFISESPIIAKLQYGMKVRFSSHLA
jgi:hypothetical protein